MDRYDHELIERKWQARWEAEQSFRSPDRPMRKKAYILDMFPYPSAEGLHVGHPEGYTASDIYARYLRMRGRDVLHPMGFDAFGLPAENYAIKTGTHPAETTKKNIENIRRQIKRLGFSYDWSREVVTSDPAYYKWTQWIFLKLYEHGLAYEADAPINWCPKDKTGLANEEIVNGKCERCGTVVTKKRIKQWLVKITDERYIERLLHGLDALDWPENIKQLQRNWIGRSEGVEIRFRIPTSMHYVLLHGYTGSPKDSFFPWLSASLRKLGAAVEIPALPDSDNPNIDEQVAFAMKTVKFRPETVLLGHSLGCAVALKVLERLKNPIRDTVLVSGFLEPKFKDHSRPYENTTTWRWDVENIRQHAGNATILHDTADYAVPEEQAVQLGEMFGVKPAILTATEPHFCAKEEPRILDACTADLPVFTTRPDTLFGATYLVLSPEHPTVEQLTTSEQCKAVERYVAAAAKKSDLDRTDLAKEKTGVFTGAHAINPANGNEIPIWIADYVLMSYGTGAIMAVPAHDERDYAFAKKHQLPVQEVVEPLVVRTTGPDAVRPDEPFEERQPVVCIVKHWSEDKYLGVRWGKAGWQGFIIGGIEAGEDVATAGAREIAEESGYQHVEFIRNVGGLVHSQFYQSAKRVNRFAHFQGAVFQLTDGVKQKTAKAEQALHEFVWLTPEEMDAFVTHEDMRLIWGRVRGRECYAGEGIARNSGGYDGLRTVDFQKSIVAWLEKEGKGRAAVSYKLRDWLFSRQRYWGEPIPIVHCPVHGHVPVPEYELPLKLPDVKKYEPTGTGKSPLANAKSWVNTTCPRCGKPAKRETDTMPQWAGSNWYFLRYLDSKNDKQLARPEKIKQWMPVDLYVGGAEHAVLHLLYARFIYKFLCDIDVVPKELVQERGDEPFTKLKNQGLILGEDGQKMSKSRGNVINPDLIVREYGADVMRLYEMFIGPFDAAKPWSTRGIVGVKRFMEKAWKVFQKTTKPGAMDRTTHALIKKVSEDIVAFKFNTAVSAFMQFVNAVADHPEAYTQSDVEAFVILLSPFAPHAAQELWSQSGHQDQVHDQPWPTHDRKAIETHSFTIVVQINGKVRDQLTVPADATEADVRAVALDPARTKVQKWLAGKSPKMVRYITGKLISIVV